MLLYRHLRRLYRRRLRLYRRQDHLDLDHRHRPFQDDAADGISG